MRSLSVVAVLAAASTTSAAVFEAETGTLAGGAVVASDLPGFSGTGYVTDFINDTAALTIDVTGLAAGDYEVKVLYNAQYGDKFTTLTVNGGSSTEVALPNVTTTTWKTATAGVFTFTAGTNTVSFARDWGYYLIDAITVTAPPVKPVVVVDVTKGGVAQAEDGIFNGVTAGSSVAGFSGTGYVEGFDAATDKLTFSLYSKTQTLYDVILGYAGVYGGKQTTMSVNGAGGGEIVLLDTSTAASPWANATAGQVLLNAGNNTISFSNDWGWYLLDALYVSPSPPPAPHQVTKVLVAPNPLPETQNLYNTLLAKYGSGTIFSGQADTSGVTWLEQNVGATPAIIGLDMIEYSPTRVVSFTHSNTLAIPANRYRNMARPAQPSKMPLRLTSAAASSPSNGIGTPLGLAPFSPILCITSNPHSGLINNDTVPWWKGIYSYGTTFNLTAALANPAGSDYALILRDLDAIAFQLLRLQAAQVPVLWRPLHEADGTWFWWGNFGPESTKALYKLMYTRFTQHHKLRNLIWLWNSVTPSWYPGSDIVDILGYDSYPAAGDHGPVGVQYQALLALGGNKKMVTLPEVGSIPDPDILKAYHADWSYFVTWNDEYINSDTYNNLAFKKKVYADPTVLKIKDLGNWKGVQVKYGQCGGTGYTGPSLCIVGTKCTSIAPPWYYQCL
jgi:mannan endo-1,4-beta-mannosidase